MYSLLPSDVANGRLDAFLKINPLPPAALFHPCPVERVADKRTEFQMGGTRSISLQTGFCVEKYLNRFLRTGLCCALPSIVSDDPEGNYDEN